MKSKLPPPSRQQLLRYLLWMETSDWRTVPTDTEGEGYWEILHYRQRVWRDFARMGLSRDSTTWKRYLTERLTKDISDDDA